MDYNLKFTEFKHASAETGTPAEPRENTGRPPDMKGDYTLEGRSPTMVSVWIEQAKDTGRPYMRGKLGSANFVDKIIAQRGATSGAPVPPGIDIPVGELRLFQNEKATPENKQPEWRGFAREFDGAYTELSAYNRFDGVQGVAKPYRPYSPPAEAPEVAPGGTT